VSQQGHRGSQCGSQPGFLFDHLVTGTLLNGNKQRDVMMAHPKTFDGDNSTTTERTGTIPFPSRFSDEFDPREPADEVASTHLAEGQIRMPTQKPGLPRPARSSRRTGLPLQSAAFFLEPWQGLRSFQELVTELVSRNVVVTCYRVFSDLSTSCKSHYTSQKRFLTFCATIG